jgi:copper resistance protein C
MARRLLTTLTLAGAVLCAGESATLAHAFLDHAVPAVGSTVHQPPVEVRIWFTEELEPAFSTVKLANASGAAVTTAAAHVDDNDKKMLILPLPALAPGSYRVMWRVLSVDTHVTEGSFRFQVAP